MVLEPILQIQSLRATHTDPLDPRPYSFPATSVSPQHLSLSIALFVNTYCLQNGKETHAGRTEALGDTAILQTEPQWFHACVFKT